MIQRKSQLTASLSWLAMVFLLTVVPSTSWGQASAPATVSVASPAQTAFNNGVAAAKVADYPLAIRYFEEARKIDSEATEIFFNLGLAESRIPGRELRAIAWFGAYLAADPTAPNAAAIKEQIALLKVTSQSNLSRLIIRVQDATTPKPDDRRTDLGYVAQLWAEAGDISAALRVANLIEDDKHSNLYRSTAYMNISEAQKNAGDIVGALESSELIQELGWKTFALKSIAIAQAKSGDIAGAQKIIDRFQIFDFEDGNTRRAQLPIKEAGIKVGITEIYLAIREAQVKVGDIVGAQKTLESAQKSAEHIQIAFYKSNALVHIAISQAELGDIVDAQKTVALMPKISEPDETQNKAMALKSIARAQAKSGDIGGAKKTNELIPNEDSYKSLVQADIAIAQVTSGDLAGALKTAESIKKDTYYQTNVFIAVTRAQVKSGDFAGARRTAELVGTAFSAAIEKGIADSQMKARDTAGASKTSDLVQGSDQGGDSQKSITSPQVKAWLKELNGDLNTEPFLDLAGFIRSQPPSDDPRKVFEAFRSTAAKIIRVQNRMHQMLRQEAKN